MSRRACRVDIILAGPTALLLHFVELLLQRVKLLPHLLLLQLFTASTLSQAFRPFETGTQKQSVDSEYPEPDV